MVRIFIILILHMSKLRPREVMSHHLPRSELSSVKGRIQTQVPYFQSKSVYSTPVVCDTCKEMIIMERTVLKLRLELGPSSFR